MTATTNPDPDPLEDEEHEDDSSGVDDPLDFDDDLASYDDSDDDLDADADSEDTEEEAEEDEDDEDEEDEPAADDSDQASLDQLLAQRRAARRGMEDSDEDDEFMALHTSATRSDTRQRVRVTPIRDRQEFVCKRCFLVKPRVQLADAERGLCRDCV